MSFVFIALAIPAVARAQDATPVAPSAEECTIAPITLERLTGVVASPVAATSPASDASPTPIALPEGTPADEATTAEIEAASREFIACLNSGDLRKVLAFYSDQAIATVVLPQFGAGATAQSVFDQIGGGQPLPPDQQTLFYSVDRVVVLADGQVAALVIGDDLSKPGPAGPALVYWVNVDGKWLIDDFISAERMAGANS